MSRVLVGAGLLLLAGIALLAMGGALAAWTVMAVDDVRGARALALGVLEPFPGGRELGARLLDDTTILAGIAALLGVARFAALGGAVPGSRAARTGLTP